MKNKQKEWHPATKPFINICSIYLHKTKCSPCKSLQHIIWKLEGRQPDYQLLHWLIVLLVIYYMICIHVCTIQRIGCRVDAGRVGVTGRQLPPLSSVLYGIISGRRSVLAAYLLLREKSVA